jgi:GGDEF domain-containing protein
LAGDIDPVSGVLSHQAFMDAATRALDESYQNDEPVALVNICVEGLRRLHDGNRWELATELLTEISSALTKRMRRDDQIGVLDGTRFFILIRRVDSELATLIIRQMMERLASICSDSQRWGAPLQVRCGVAGSGIGKPGLRELVERACENAKTARQRNLLTINDLEPTPEAAKA